MAEESRLVKRLVVEVFEDKSRTITGFGWGAQPTIVFIGSHYQPNDRPWLVSTEAYSVSEIGRILAGGLDLTIEQYEKQEREGTLADDDEN
jgi:hypothetical protein